MWPLCDFSVSSALWLLGPLLLGLITAWFLRSSAQDVQAAYVAPEASPVPERQAFVAAPEPEPVVAAPVVAPAPAPVPASAPTASAAIPVVAAAAALTAIGIPAAIGGADDLLKIKGIGPKLNEVLNGLGVHRFDQIANWSAGDVDKVDDHLGAFKNRIGQEEWIPQAKLLAAGNNSEWQRIYGAGTIAAGAAAAAGAIALTSIGIPAAVGAPNDLLQLKGVGPKLNDLLISLGVRRFDQIANWTAEDTAKVDGHLGAFKGRIDREMWCEQAGYLASGNVKAFEAKFGALDSENS
jgi:predicted flap endonuclease-1-like 5' DNA nuclease